ncbi:chlorinating enzyme [Paraburkholderia sp. A1RI_3L]|uniref:chlorinating enzyme n=1 Tax=Paraburkholderia TaxID=1822464 RepID=UPI003B75F07D
MDYQAERTLFAEQGFIGPFRLWEPETMNAWWKERRAELLDQNKSARRCFDNPVNYDRHLDIDALTKIVSEPEIVRRCQNLIGPDVLCWRTEFFPKNPGDAGTGWHQVETYAIGEAEAGMLEPSERSEGVPMELTCWVAFTDATRENGCLKFIPGSHRQWRYDEKGKIKWRADHADNTFFGYNYDELRIDKNWHPDEQEVRHMEMRAGEFVIFTARCIHGSNPNTSRKQRMGFSIRVVPTHVKVYEGMTEFNEFGHRFDLARHGCVLVAGHDDFGHNRLTNVNAWGNPFATLSAGDPSRVAPAQQLQGA